MHSQGVLLGIDEAKSRIGSIYMDELDIRDEVGIRPTPSKELEPIQVDDQSEHLVYIGSRLAKDVKDLLVPFLK